MLITYSTLLNVITYFNIAYAIIQIECVIKSVDETPYWWQHL